MTKHDHSPANPLTEDQLRIIATYGHLLNNTGGNDPGELILELESYADGCPNRIASTNIVVFSLALAVSSQVNLLLRLEREGKLEPKSGGSQ